MCVRSAGKLLVLLASGRSEGKVSDGPQGYGWWQASDLKWYPPERHRDFVPSLPPPPPPEPSKAPPPATPQGPRRLSEAERNQILDVALLSRARPSIVIIDGFARASGPTIRRSTTSAEIEWVTPPTHYAVMLLSLLLSVFSCGLYLIVWFIQTLRRPKVQTLHIDEYGNQIWGNKSISTGQRVLSVVVGLLILYWLYLVGALFAAFDVAGKQQHGTHHYGGMSTGQLVSAPAPNAGRSPF